MLSDRFAHSLLAPIPLLHMQSIASTDLLLIYFRVPMTSVYATTLGIPPNVLGGHIWLPAIILYLEIYIIISTNHH